MDIDILLKERDRLRKEKKYSEADEVRKQIEEMGYVVIDTPTGTQIELPKKEEVTKKQRLIGVFGSGETSPTGRRVHEFLIKDLPAPVKVALLETPAGFEANPLNWYRKVAEMMEIGLQNYHPEIKIVEALRSDGDKSTNNSEIVASLLHANYIHTGAGSPSYAAKHLQNSLAYKYIVDQFKKGTRLSFASAAAVAFSKYLLPVYEIYKVGEDLHWKNGLNFFANFGLNLTIIPHWNNNEGGEEIDTSRCFMGRSRFEKLLSLLPAETTVLGIDEQTACVFDFDARSVTVMGNGSSFTLKSGKSAEYVSGTSFSFDNL